MGRPTPPPVHAPGGWRGPPSSAVKRVTDPSCVQGALSGSSCRPEAPSNHAWSPTEGWVVVAGARREPQPKVGGARSGAQGRGKGGTGGHGGERPWVGERGMGTAGGPRVQRACACLFFCCSDWVWTRAPRRRGGGCSGWPTPLPRWRPTRRVGGGRAVWRTGTDRSVVAHARSPAGRHARPFPHVPYGRSPW